MSDEMSDYHKKMLARLEMMPTHAEGYISPLTEEVMKVKRLANAPDLTKNVVKGVTDHINTNEVQKLISGSQLQSKLASILESRAASKAAQLAGKAGGMMSGVTKHIPILGGLAVGLGTALATGDASAGEQAAIPLLNEADNLGAPAGSLEDKMESGIATQDELDQLRKRFQ